MIKQKVKQKGKGKGGPKFVTKQEKRESFFNFFSPPKVPENEDDIDDVLQVQLLLLLLPSSAWVPTSTPAALQALITEDFDIGFSIKEKLIPRAVLYYTGEAVEGDSEDEDDEDDEDDDDEDDED